MTLWKFSVGGLLQCPGAPYVNEIWTMSNDNNLLKRLMSDSPKTCILSLSPDSSIEVHQRTRRLSKLILAALEDSASLQYELGVYFYCCSVQLALKAKQELQDLFGEEEEVSQKCNRRSPLLSSFFLFFVSVEHDLRWLHGLDFQSKNMQCNYYTAWQFLTEAVTWLSNDSLAWPELTPFPWLQNFIQNSFVEQLGPELMGKVAFCNFFSMRISVSPRSKVVHPLLWIERRAWLHCKSVI